MLSNRELESYRHFRRVGNGAMRALFLARSEIWARDNGVEVEWDFDSDADNSWMDAQTLREWKSGKTCLAEVVVRHDATGICTAMGGAHLLGSDPWGPDPYKREIAAELAGEIREAVELAIADAEAYPC